MAYLTGVAPGDVQEPHGEFPLLSQASQVAHAAYTAALDALGAECRSGGGGAQSGECLALMQLLKDRAEKLAPADELEPEPEERVGSRSRSMSRGRRVAPRRSRAKTGAEPAPPISIAPQFQKAGSEDSSPLGAADESLSLVTDGTLTIGESPVQFEVASFGSQTAQLEGVPAVLASPRRADSTLLNGPALSGRIAVITRGGCSFCDKVRVALAHWHMPCRPHTRVHGGRLQGRNRPVSELLNPLAAWALHLASPWIGCEGESVSALPLARHRIAGALGVIFVNADDEIFTGT